MIKVRNNEYREPMVGDRVEVKIGTCAFDFGNITEITPLGIVVKTLSNELLVSPNDCELMHRPFAVGDKYQGVCGDGLCNWSKEYTVRSQGEADCMNAQESELFFRHADHAIRDHEDYKP